MASRIAQVVIGALDVEAIAAFWCDVLGWVVLDREDGVVCIGADDGSLPGIDVAPVDDLKDGSQPAAPGPAGGRDARGR